MFYELRFNGWNLLLLVSIVIGLTFACLLFLTRRSNQAANRFLALVLLIMAAWIFWVANIDIRLENYFPRLNWIPFTYSLALGPALYFYVRKLCRPEFRFRAIHLWHFSPVLLELGVHLFELAQSYQQGIRIHRTTAFYTFNPVLQFLAISSVTAYSLLAVQEIRRFHRWLADHYSNYLQYQLHWLRRLLILFALLWISWIPYVLVDFLFFDYRLDFPAYYPLYVLIAVMYVWIGVEAFLRPEYIILETREKKEPASSNGQAPSEEVQQQAQWLRDQMAHNLFYLNAELSLQNLAEDLDLHPHALSRIINQGIGTNFSDFINEYRVREVIRKMQDPKLQHITLLGIAYDSGFNSKTSFNRIFKNSTGKTPSEFREGLVR